MAVYIYIFIWEYQSFLLNGYTWLGPIIPPDVFGKNVAVMEPVLL